MDENEKNIIREKKILTLKAALAGMGIGIVFCAALLLILTGGFRGLGAAARFTNLMNTIRRYYIADYDITDVTDAALKGAVDSLDDDWSYYMDAEEYEAYQNTSANVYHGIGISVAREQETGGFLVETVTKDQPADLAGIIEGDILLAVDGNDVTGEDFTVYDLRALIQADYNKQAQILLQHADGTQETVSVACVTIYSTPVEYEMLQENIGYICISNFRTGAADDAIAAIEDLTAQGAEALVFDVRSDPGGHLDELTALLDYLLPEGDIFIRISKNGSEKVFTSDAACVDLPMAVLINGDSYSAAEFFAAALSEYGKAVTVGTATTGKSRVQVTLKMADGGALHISHYNYLTPDRVDLYEAGGLVPDVQTELTEEETEQFETGWLEPEDDPQVQAAVQAVSGS